MPSPGKFFHSSRGNVFIARGAATGLKDFYELGRVCLRRRASSSESEGNLGLAERGGSGGLRV